MVFPSSGSNPGCSQSKPSSSANLYRRKFTSAGADPPCDYLPLSVVTSVFCCLPIGIMALYFSYKTRDCVNRGDMNMAAKYSALAFTVNMAALSVAVFTWTLFFVLLYHLETHIPLFEPNTKFNRTESPNINF